MTLKVCRRILCIQLGNTIGPDEALETMPEAYTGYWVLYCQFRNNL